MFRLRVWAREAVMCGWYEPFWFGYLACLISLPSGLAVTSLAMRPSGIV